VHPSENKVSKQASRMGSQSSSDEGEIVENRVGNSKASTLPHIDGHGVDRIDRTRAKYSRSRSPESNGSRYISATSRRSRSPRGLKRPHDDRDSYRGGRLDPDPRRFRVHYEDYHDTSRRNRISYDDEDRPVSHPSATKLYYDDRDRYHGRDRARDRSLERDRYHDKRPRNRTRSPHNSSRRERDRGDYSSRDHDRIRRDIDRDGDRDTDRSIKSNRDQNGTPSSETPDARRRTSTVKFTGTASSDADSTTKSLDNTSLDNSGKAPEPGGLEDEKPIDIDAEIERRRRRRQELLARSRAATPMLVQALQSSEKANVPSPTTTRGSTPMPTGGNTPQSGKIHQVLT
jgi:serine/threonine-protein kinase PRP4